MPEEVASEEVGVGVGVQNSLEGAEIGKEANSGSGVGAASATVVQKTGKGKNSPRKERKGGRRRARVPPAAYFVVPAVSPAVV